MMHRDQRMKTTVEGKGIYAGNWTFLFSTLGGAAAGLMSIIQCINEWTMYRRPAWEGTLQILAWGIGGTCVGVGIGSILGLLVGSTASRSFTVVYCVAIAIQLTF